MKRLIASLVAASLLLATDGSIAPLPTFKPAERRHWAFQPRKDATPPAFTAAAGKAWVSTPIDAFLLAGLKKAVCGPLLKQTALH